MVQLADWQALGRLHVPDASWVLRLLGSLVGPLGGDPVLAHKAGASLLAALCLPAAWALGRRHSPALAWLLAGWAAASPTLSHLAGDFAKNLGAVAPGLAFAAAWHLRGPARWAALLATGLLCATAHRLGAAFLLICLGGAGLGLLLRDRGALPGRAALLVFFALLGVFAALSTALPGLLHPADLERLEGQLSLGLGPPSPLPWLALRSTHPLQALELALPWLALGACAWSAVVRPASRPAALGLGAALAAVLLVPWRRDVLDLGYRLCLMGPVLAAVTLAWLLPRERALPRVPPLLGALLLLAALPLSRAGLDPAAHPPYARYEALISELPRPLPALLIARSGLTFLYDHRTGEEAMAWAPEPELDPTTVGRIVWGVTPAEWRALAPEAAPLVVLDPDHLYAREDHWRAFVQRVQQDAGDPAADALLERIADPRNPSRVRPEGLTRGR